MKFKLDHAYRQKEWLHVPVVAGGDADKLRAGSHAHDTRIGLLALGLWPAKWINALFSTGGIAWSEKGELRLRAFPAAPASDALQRQAASTMAASGGGYGADWPEVLYEDDWCLVLNKPAGLPVHGNGEDLRAERAPAAVAGRAAMIRSAPRPSTLDEAAACRGLASGDALPVRHIHRIDDDTSGPVLYAKNDLAQGILDAAMREKKIGRCYWAVVHGVPEPREGVIDAPIGKDRHHKARRRVAPGGDHAITRYEVLEVLGASASLIELTLETGRTHQIRVHMSHQGHPLIGDGLYGGSSALLGRQALHGRQLRFTHPWSGEALVVDAPLPADIERLLERLRR